MIYTEKFKNLVLYVLQNDHYKNYGIKKLNKMLYFIDFYYYRENEEFISGVNYAKGPMGPIIDNYRNLFDKLINDKILRKKEVSGAGSI